MLAVHRRLRLPLYLTVLAALVAAAPACGGGGGGGSGPEGAGQGLVLMNFLQAGQDNVPINRILKFVFSEAVDPDTIGAHSIQIREGPSYGRTASGSFVIDGASPNIVYFEPVLLSVCGDDTSAGLSPGTTYKVTFVGYPEEFSIANTKGQSLEATLAFEFGTRRETDPGYLEDQIPGQAPYVLSRSPDAGMATCPVDTSREGAEVYDEIVLEFSENIDPCSVTNQSVKIAVYEWGGATPPDLGVENPAGSGIYSGFVPAADSLPDDPTSWGGNAVPLGTPQAVLCSLNLDQNFDATRLHIVPQGGELPENALVVVTLTFGLTDFGGDPLEPEQFSFTTENTEAREGYLEIPFDDTTPVATDVTTADVNTARSPGRAQGWMLFAGDGDNGAETKIPAFPLFNASSYAYISCDPQANDGSKDDFNPNDDTTLHTGASRVPVGCTNSSDGSTAVEWEFRSFRVRADVTVTILGMNPAIIKSLGDIVIEANGKLVLAGEDGEDGHIFSYNYNAADRDGGVGIAGAGDGGVGHNPTSPDWSKPGFAGYGSPEQFIQGGMGAGDGGVGTELPTAYNYSGGRSGVGGGGGGHAITGSDGGTVGPGSPFKWAAAELRGTGGDAYPTAANAEEMLTPSAGSGGGGGGWSSMYNNTTYYYQAADGGGGGAGGGFVDLTSQGNIRVYGLIDARGGDGGSGGVGGYLGGGGGGGGSGGGVRLLTPNDIDLSNGSILTTGGKAGKGNRGQYATSGTGNDGGAGGWGRIALEDGDSVITGLASAALVPMDGQEGFYKGLFQPTRFTAGGTVSLAQTGYMFLGPLKAPDLQSLSEADFVAGIPAGADRGTETAMVIDIQGRPMLSDGSADMTPGSETGWYCIGYFAPGDSPTLPDWTADSYPPTTEVLPEYDPTNPDLDLVGEGIGSMPDSNYVQVRIWIWVPDSNFGPQDPGPYVDDMRIPFLSDQ